MAKSIGEGICLGFSIAACRCHSIICHKSLVWPKFEGVNQLWIFFSVALKRILDQAGFFLSLFTSCWNACVVSSIGPRYPAPLGLLTEITLRWPSYSVLRDVSRINRCFVRAGRHAGYQLPMPVIATSTLATSCQTFVNAAKLVVSSLGSYVCDGLA